VSVINFETESNIEVQNKYALFIIIVVVISLLT